MQRALAVESVVMDATPVFKKIPAFFLFLVVWLAVVINVAQPLSSATDERYNPLVFRSLSQGLWAGKPYVNWIPEARRVLEDEYGVFSDCSQECDKTLACTAFLVKRTNIYSSSGDCYLWEQTTIPSLANPDLIESCRYACTTYIKSSTNPFTRESLDWQPSFSSPFHPGNQGATQPLYYGCILCIAMITVDCIIYWTFFTLSVPAGRLFRFIFFATMVGSLVCGAFIGSWVDHESVCPSYYSYYSSSFDSTTYEGLTASVTCTPDQRLLKDAALGATVVLILMGVWPVLALPWTLFSIIVLGALVGLYSLIMQADFVKIWTYLVLAQWLVWQEDEQQKSLAEDRAKKVGAPTLTNNSNQGTNVGLHSGIVHMTDMKGVQSELINRYQDLERENDALTRRFDESLRAQTQALSHEREVSAKLREENAKLRAEIAALKLEVKPPAAITNIRGGAPTSTYTPVSPPTKTVYDGEMPHYEAPSAYTPAGYSDNQSLFSPPPYSDPYASAYEGSSSSTYGPSSCGSCDSSAPSSYGSSSAYSSSYGDHADRS